MRILLTISIIFLFTSCAKTPEEEIAAAISEAKILLSEGRCTEARSVLTDIGDQSDNPVYVSLMASTYGCEAGYSELDIISSLGSLNASNLINSLTSMTTSNPADFDYTDFGNLMTGLSYILNSAGTTPSTVSRESEFGQVKGTDLSLQALYLIMYTMGKFFAYFGDADTTGAKAAGSLSNVCVGNYNITGMNGWLPANSINGCNSVTSGHPDLTAPETAANIKTRLCYGVVLFNNLFDILGNVTLSSNSSLGDLSSVKTALDAIYTAASAVETTMGGVGVTAADGSAIPAIKSITSQALCEAASLDDIVIYYIIIFETQYNN